MFARISVCLALVLLASCGQKNEAKPGQTSAPVVQPLSDPDTRANERVVKSFADAFNDGDVDTAATYFADSGINHGREVSRNDIKTIMKDIKARFPDAHFNIMMTVSQGEWVVAREMYGGTHKGTGKLPVDGGLLVGVPPTGKNFEVQTIHMYRIRGDKIIEHWATRDDLGMMQQLGLLPDKPPSQWLAGAAMLTPAPASANTSAQ